MKVQPEKYPEQNNQVSKSVQHRRNVESKNQVSKSAQLKGNPEQKKQGFTRRRTCLMA